MSSWFNSMTSLQYALVSHRGGSRECLFLFLNTLIDSGSRMYALLLLFKVLSDLEKSVLTTTAYVWHWVKGRT